MVKEKLNAENQRHSLRLPGYDYREAGGYFITLCCRDSKILFGKIIDGKVNLNNIGKIVDEEWRRTAFVRSNVELDVFIIMPNHLHAIIILKNVGATRRVAPTIGRNPRGPLSGSIGAIIGQFKSTTTKRINNQRNSFLLRVWQRNYYEHIIRTESELEQIREYIVLNPEKWSLDQENPDVARSSSNRKDEMEIILGMGEHAKSVTGTR